MAGSVGLHPSCKWEVRLAGASLRSKGYLSTGIEGECHRRAPLVVGGFEAGTG